RVLSQARAMAAGLHSAFLFPVAFNGRTIGVISFSSREVREPDERLLKSLDVAAQQLGQFLARKRDEDALRRFRTALDGSADMVFLLDLRTLRLVDFNGTAASYLGYDRDEMVGMRPDYYLADVTETELRESFDALLGVPGRADSLERRFRRKDGQTFP